MPAKRKANNTSEPRKKAAQKDDVLNLSWRVHGISAVHGFEKSTVALRALGHALAAFVRSEMEDKTQTVSAEVKLLDTAGLITMLVVEVGEKTAYGLLYSSKAMSLLLLRGIVSVAALLSRWVEQRFDCKVSLLRVSSQTLALLVHHWTALQNVEDRKIELIFLFPEIPGLRKLTVSVAADNVRRFKADDVELLDGIAQEYYTHTKINLRLLRLSQIGTGAALFSGESLLKIYSQDNVFEILESIAAYSASHVRLSLTSAPATSS